jgi:hypothetical protein
MTFLGHTLKLHADRGVISGRKMQLMYGRGNGGFTAFIALDCCKRGLNQNFYQRAPFQVGVVTNANLVPFTSN